MNLKAIMLLVEFYKCVLGQFGQMYGLDSVSSECFIMSSMYKEHLLGWFGLYKQLWEFLFHLDIV